jgi:hypothetical protein
MEIGLIDLLLSKSLVIDKIPLTIAKINKKGRR